jgi:hypothetical protein
MVDAHELAPSFVDDDDDGVHVHTIWASASLRRNIRPKDAGALELRASSILQLMMMMMFLWWLLWML